MIRLRTRDSSWPRIPASPLRCLVTGMGLILASLSPVGAQSKGDVDQTAPIAAPAQPAREGNIYGHKDHQPTESEVGGAEGNTGVDYPSSANEQDVERSVQDLLRQTDKMDEAAEKQGQAFPPGSPSQPPK